ncbi:MAG: hypothetical protein ACFFA6_08730 [Promethearchaeota archaeon]
MSSTEAQNQLLSTLLEKILFNQEELEILKNKIYKFSIKELTGNELRNYIFRIRIHIMEKLLEFFPFYLKESLNNKSIDSLIHSESNKKIREKIKEREDLLEKVAFKVDIIHKKLKDKEE